jgi:hypothetical protein
MRRRTIATTILVLASVFSASAPALAGPGGTGNTGNKGGGKAKARNAQFGWAIKKAKRTPGQPAKRVFGCETRRNVPETGDTMRRCPGLYGDKWFPLAKSVPGTGPTSGFFDYGVAPPEPIWTVSSHWYTQRAGYFHLSAEQQNPVADIRVLVNGQPTGEKVGEAVLYPMSMNFNPGGDDTFPAAECQGPEMFKVFVRGITEEERPDACWFKYYVSSRNQAGGKYKTTLTVDWAVKSFNLEGGGEVTGNVEPHPTASTKYVEVKELQALITCAKPNNDCFNRNNNNN